MVQLIVFLPLIAAIVAGLNPFGDGNDTRLRVALEKIDEDRPA